MSKRFLEQHMSSDRDYCHLEGEHLPGESMQTWMRRRMFRQGIWRAVLSDLADDWGRFRAEPRYIVSMLNPDLPGHMVDEELGWLLPEVQAALDHYEAINWVCGFDVGAQRYGQIWNWFGHHAPQWASASKYPGVPTEAAQCEAARRGFPPAARAGDGMSFEKFVSLMTYNGSMRHWAKMHPELGPPKHEPPAK